MRSRFRPALLIAVAIAFAAGCAPFEALSTPAKLDVTLRDMHGRDVRLADFRGRPIVINFWATWCGPCRQEMPQLVALAARYQERGLVVLGISVDDGPEAMQAFAKTYGVDYPLLEGRTQPEAVTALEYFGLLPTTIFIDRGGVIVGRQVGLATDASFERRIEALF
ncbi:MAG: TlpA disulfide reductase family protein [Vicinamibacterales bacterium]